MSILKETSIDKLKVKAYSTRAEMGEAAANEAAEAVVKALAKKAELRIIFAAAPSQNEFLESLLKHPEIEWNRINAFHMDEYVGLDPAAPQGFGNFLRDHIFGKAPFKSVTYLNGNAKDLKAECARYTALLKAAPIDFVFMGIGENDHIAFNDPWVAKFDDPETVKVVELDHKCRQQQVNDGCFQTINDVPTHALTLTVPTLFAGGRLFCVVPAPTKAQAVLYALTKPVVEDYPATILRRHDNATMYLDGDSSKQWLAK